MLILPEFLISGLKLFQFRVVEGKKDFLVISNRQLGKNMCSSLNADLHLVNLKPCPACICGHGFEDCMHLLLECLFYNENRAILFNKLKNYVVINFTT
jgi:hypothetical protein